MIKSNLSILSSMFLFFMYLKRNLYPIQSHNHFHLHFKLLYLGLWSFLCFFNIYTIEAKVEIHFFSLWTFSCFSTSVKQINHWLTMASLLKINWLYVWVYKLPIKFHDLYIISILTLITYCLDYYMFT